MDWERAKTILIIAFLALNVVLFAFLKADDVTKYMAADEDKRAIIKVLSDNNVTILCGFDSYPSPVKIMTVTAREWYADAVRDTFFAGAEDIKRTNEAGNVIYRLNDRSVTVFGGGRSHVEIDAFLPKTQNSSGEWIANSFIKELGVGFEDFVLYKTARYSNGTVYYYNELKDKKAIFSSQVVIDIYDETETATITVKKYDFADYQVTKRDVVSAAEALLLFSRNIGEDGATVVAMELGYYVDEAQKDVTYKTKPCYRIITEGGEVFLVDAISNSLL